ncbi:hypothetical protein K458DRAFT_435486 [Lentithecium fluviatile CBS 122367]|uniref:DNase I-like protein n=1 Tax=Lentithecium fluviatile CBS 122367 TaxID=1168545 RepID=A0A6G1IKP2_9PLEO|nr:hypothetical protein K458DRAFT_435486 [Lentithecium fluviatile CBS 122367]
MTAKLSASSPAHHADADIASTCVSVPIIDVRLSEEIVAHKMALIVHEGRRAGSCVGIVLLDMRRVWGTMESQKPVSDIAGDGMCRRRPGLPWLEVQARRVSVAELTSATRKFALFDIYAVNGTDSPYRDAATGVAKGTRHDRKLEFHRLLTEECLCLEKEGWQVLLTGDMNVAPTVLDGYPRLRTFPHQHVLNRADFNAKFLGGENKGDGGGEVFAGVDVWRKMYAGERRYTYYPRGKEWRSSCDRMDYVVVGRKMWDEGLVMGAGIMDSEAERGTSDHVPIWVDISFGKGEETVGRPTKCKTFYALRTQIDVNLTCIPFWRSLVIKQRGIDIAAENLDISPDRARSRQAVRKRIDSRDTHCTKEGSEKGRAEKRGRADKLGCVSMDW